MPTVYLLHGFVGSGKTTFARKLQIEKKAVRFSPDEWMIALHGDNPPADLFERYHTKIMHLIWQQVENTVHAGADAILDFGFWTRASRDEALIKVKSFHAVPLLYALQTSFAQCTERVLRRTATMPQGALVIDQNAIDLFWSKFEPLQADEDAILVAL